MERGNHLRSKLYLIGDQEEPIVFIERNEEKEKTFNQWGIEESKHTFVDVKQIADEILNKEFYGYSSLMFFIDIDSSNYNKQFRDAMAEIYTGLKKNSNLRHVTKFLMFYSRIDDLRNDIERLKKNRKNKPINIDEFMSNRTEYISHGDHEDELISNRAEYRRHGDLYLNRFNELLLTIKANTDNLTIIQFCNKNLVKDELSKNMPLFFEFTNVYDAVQAMADALCDDSRNLNFFSTTCAGGNYIFNINPALVLVLNQITSPDEELLHKREASLYDLIALQRTFVGKRIPTYIITDASQEDIYRLKLKLRFYNFSGIKYIFIIINAHGFDGDIIVTKNGSYNIRDDIWLPMTENPTLKETQKFVIANACRLELTDNCRKLLENLAHKFNENKIESNIDENYDNGMMIYSTTKGNESERYGGLGCIFLQEWSKQFAKNFDENLMETIFKDTAQEMGDWGSAQMPDLVVTDGEKHKIKMEPVNFINFKPMLDGLLEGNLRREKDNDIIFMDAFVVRNEKDELELMDGK